MIQKAMLLVLCAVMALGAPLAQAAACMMHAPQATETSEAPCPHHPQPLAAKPKPTMSVAECLQTPATPALTAANNLAENAPLFIVPSAPLWVGDAAPKQTVAVQILRVPPPDRLAFFGHRRI